jgi:hypothetical protein
MLLQLMQLRLIVSLCRSGLFTHEQSNSSLLVRELLGLRPSLYLLLNFVIAVVFAEVVKDKEVLIEFDGFFVAHHDRYLVV